MKSRRWVFIPLMAVLFLFGCSHGRTYLLNIRYQSYKEFPSFQQKIGTTLGILPLKDERKETLYIGLYTPYQGISSSFKSDPFPLEKAIEESLSRVVSRHGVKPVPVSDWDGKPESLKGMDADSILMVEIKRFWIEGNASLFRTKVHAKIHFMIHLGVKREGKVFTKNVDVEKEMTVSRLTPEKAGEIMNQALMEIFDAFFSNPY